MIKPVTFKAAQNFKANLYALEVRSRFIDPNNANKYYAGYGEDLAATVIGTSGIQIGSGAFLVQGRMVEIVASETVAIAYEEGKVGYIVCRIETSPSSDAVHCSLVARTGASLDAIQLSKEDTYSYDSEETNKVYELPLYAFGMQNNTITITDKKIKPCLDLYDFNNRLNNIGNVLFPIGSLYLSVTNVNPGTFLGGTWEAWGSGRFPVSIDPNDPSFANVEAMGGEKEVTLNEQQIPAHSHYLDILASHDGGLSGISNSAYITDGIGDKREKTYATGGNGAHNNLPPYIVCYMWKRVA